MKRWTAMIVGLCSLLAIAAPAAAQNETRIGIVTLQMKAPYFIAMVRALEAEGRAHNVRTSATVTSPRSTLTSRTCWRRELTA
jgi:ABC-type sugar transport system substrate-binding protein